MTRTDLLKIVAGVAGLLAVWVALLLGINAFTAPADSPSAARPAEAAFVWPLTAQDRYLLYSSYGWAETGPVDCPAEARFKAGTEVVYTYAPQYLPQQSELVARLYALDQAGHYQSAVPLAEFEYTQPAGSLPHVAISHRAGDNGSYQVEMFQRVNGLLTPLGRAVYSLSGSAKIASSGRCEMPVQAQVGKPGLQTRAGADEPAPSEQAGKGSSSAKADAAPVFIPNASAAQGQQQATPEPEVMPTAVPAVYASPLVIQWEGQMKYQGYTAASDWCQTAMVYHNKSDQPLSWPDYRADMMISNKNGDFVAWKTADYYTRQETDDYHAEKPCGQCNDQGYRGGQGVAGVPAAIGPNNSAAWTWRTFTDAPNQYCSQVSVKWQGWRYLANFDQAGRIIGTEVYNPDGKLVEQIHAQAGGDNSINIPFIQ